MLRCCDPSVKVAASEQAPSPQGTCLDLVHKSADARRADRVHVDNLAVRGQFGANVKRRKSSQARPSKTYPLQTNGSRIAAEARRETNKLSREERRKLFAEAMVTIYGGRPPKTAGAGH